MKQRLHLQRLQRLQHLPRPLGVVAALALSVALCAGLAACAGPYATAWRTTEAVRQVGNQVDHSLGVVAQKKHAECITAHGRQTAGYAACIDKHQRALAAWRLIARPAVNSALATAVGAIQLAERVKPEKPVDWAEALRPAVCAIARVVEQWGHLMGNDKDRITSLLSGLKGVACHD